jgi:hypothetical protein
VVAQLAAPSAAHTIKMRINAPRWNDGKARRSGRDLAGRGRATNDYCAGGYAGCAVSAPASPMVLPGVVLSFLL